MQISISMTMIILGHNNENIKYIQAEFDPRHLIHSFYNMSIKYASWQNNIHESAYFAHQDLLYCLSSFLNSKI